MAIMFLLYPFFQLTASLNVKKNIIGEWTIYNKLDEQSLYTIEFHDFANKLNSTNKINNTISGTIWLNDYEKEDLDEEEQHNIYNPDNFLLCSVKMTLYANNEGYIEIIDQYNKNKDISLFNSSHFIIFDNENKSTIISINSSSSKLSCTFINSTFGLIKYSHMFDGYEKVIELYIIKSKELSFIQWNKLFVYLFYAAFITMFCRTIFVTISIIFQRNKQNQTTNKSENIKEIAVNKNGIDENDKKPHIKTE